MSRRHKKQTRHCIENQFRSIVFMLNYHLALIVALVRCCSIFPQMSLRTGTEHRRGMAFKVSILIFAFINQTQHIITSSTSNIYLIHIFIRSTMTKALVYPHVRLKYPQYAQSLLGFSHTQTCNLKRPVRSKIQCNLTSVNQGLPTGTPGSP